MRTNHIACVILFGIFLQYSCGKSDPIIDVVPDIEDPEQKGYEYPEGKIFFEYPPQGLEGTAFYEPMGGMGVFPKDHGGFIHYEYGVERNVVKAEV